MRAIPHRSSSAGSSGYVPLYWTLTLMLYLTAWKFPHLMNATRALPVELIKSLFFVPFAKSNGLYQTNLVRGLDSQLRDVFLHDAV